MVTLIAAILIGQVLTPEESKGLDTYVAAIVAAGFPDGAKSSVYFGELTASATFDPSKDPMPLPSECSKMQESGAGGKMTYHYEFDGLHFKLADGSWIIAMSYRFKPKEGDTVKPSGNKVDLATLTADAANDHPYDAEKSSAGWIERLAPEYRKRAAQAMNLLVPVSYRLKINPDSMAPAMVLLHRAGWADALTAAVSIADQRSRSFWQLRPWTDPEWAFDPTGKYPKARDLEEAWKKAHAQVKPETPEFGLRRALYRWCQAQILSDDSIMTPEAAAAACKASLDPKDPQGHGARIAALLAGAKVPIVPGEKADLAKKLQSWELRPREPKMIVTCGKDGMSMGTSFVTIPPAYEPAKADLDALVGLLGDERPSRCWDFSGPRTAGDNAWRALATLLEADPRTLAGRSTDSLWTKKERTEASTAFQKWWKDHRTEYVGK